MDYIHILLSLLMSYLIGSFQSSYIFGKIIKKVDIRDYGSGNPGATNAIRVFGFKFGMVCLIMDALKGALAILLIKQFFGAEEVFLQLISGLAVIVGHNHPFYMGFRGGKGVAASIGIILMIDWRVFLIAAVPAAIVLLTSRIMSISSLTFEFVSLVMFIMFYFTDENLYIIALAAALYPLISFWRHRKNIVRLMSGEEPKLWGDKKKVKGPDGATDSDGTTESDEAKE